MNGFVSLAQLSYAAALVATSMIGALVASVQAPQAPIATMAEAEIPLAAVEDGAL